MNDDISLPFIALLISFGLILLIHVIYGIVKGELNPYRFGFPKCRRKEKPVFFWICATGGLLMGLLIVLFAVFSLLIRWK